VILRFFRRQDTEKGSGSDANPGRGELAVPGGRRIAPTPSVCPKCQNSLECVPELSYVCCSLGGSRHFFRWTGEEKAA
jgi:hypothetical protein